ncbi:uncharacterized protein Dvar_56120 [Desulfosarcina variabilis str. Montpellier]
MRLAAFKWLAEQEATYGDVLPRELLGHGFDFRGKNVKFIGPQGIFKPKILSEIPLSITTSPKSPYNDSFGNDHLLRYKYRGVNPQHHENISLRKAMNLKRP